MSNLASPTNTPTTFLSSEVPAISLDDLVNIFNDVDEDESYSQNASESSFSSSLSVDFYVWLDETFDGDKHRDKSFTNPYSFRARAVFIALYSSIFLMSMVGNSLVCLVVVRNKRMRGVTNFFLANQACSDMLMTAFNIPFIVYTQLTYDWPFGYVMCHMTDYLAVASVYVSCFTFTAIALDRHRVIVDPLRPRISMTTAITIAVGIWILATVLPLPFAIFRTVIAVDRRFNSSFQMCVGNYPSSAFGQYLVLATFIYQFAIPLTLNTIAYIHIGVRLWTVTYIGDVTARQQQANLQAKMRTTRMLVLVVAAFAICWFPLNIYLLISHFHPRAKNTLAYLWCHFVAMSSVCINPVAFGFLNENFRKELRLSLNCCVRKVKLSRRHYAQGRRTRSNRLSSNRNSQGMAMYSVGNSPTRVTSESVQMDTLVPHKRNKDCDAVQEQVKEENGNVSNDSGVA